MSTIAINESKCVGCNSCIRVCSVGDANIAKIGPDGKIIIKIDDEKCIKCGACISACSHGAREYNDDTEDFFRALDSNEELAVIVAPAIKIALEDKWASILTWFRRRGIKLIYDVSLGADICTWAHLRYLRQNPSAKIISQPCAAIVNYVLKHEHTLVNSLSPINSPMMCTAIYMRKYMNFDGKIAAFSPCIAKKDEFIQTGNFINYNVTFKKLDEYLEKQGVNYRNLAEKSDFNFDGPRGYMGAVYPKPGGLKQNLLLHAPELNCISSEGIGRVYDELKAYSHAIPQDVPTVFDVLNCEFGCIDGPGVGKPYDIFRINSIMRNNEKHLQQAKLENSTKKGEDKQFAWFDKELNMDYFRRDYALENVNVRHITDLEIRRSFEKLHKATYSEMNLDCHSCGYKGCREMAEAIAKGLSIPENCRYFNDYVTAQHKEKIDKISSEIFVMASELEEIIVSLSDSIDKVDSQISYISESGVKSTESMNSVEEYMSQLNKMTGTIVSLMKVIDTNVESYSEMTNSVRAIAGKINLLSLNASIESARAGEAGKAFAVVASNIRNLSESSRQSVENAETNEESIKSSIIDVNRTIDDFGRNFGKLIEMIRVAKENVNLVADRSQVITTSMETLDNISKKIADIVKKTTIILT